MNIFIYDTETTGFALFKEPPASPRQPNICQLAGLKMNIVTGDVLGESSAIIKPDGWKIPTAASNVHGITTSRALKEGVPYMEYLPEFLKLSDGCEAHACYNSPFDKMMMRIEWHKRGMEDEFAKIPNIDVMKVATPLCKMSPTKAMLKKGMKRYKTPKLEQAMSILLDEEFSAKAHDAMNDVEATARLLKYFWDEGKIDLEKWNLKNRSHDELKVKEATPADTGDLFAGIM